MATYIPNATQTTEPVESRSVESAALEFRTLKASINGRFKDVQAALDAETTARIAGDTNLQAQNNAQDVRLTAIENALPFIGEGGLPGTVYVQRLSGTGAQTVFTLNTVPHSVNAVDIYIDGIYQNKDTFTVSGADVIFSKAPPAGTNNIEVQVTATIALGETDASLVTYGGTTVADQLDAISAVSGSSLVGFQQAGTGAVATTVQSKLREYVSVKDFGALGDGSGRTPADDGINVLAEPWNTWDNTPFKTNLPWSPYNAGGVFNPPRPQPFANDDTWDFIGCSLALWSGTNIRRSVYAPAGTYVINVSSATNKGSLNGIVIMKGMEQTIYGDGPYETLFTTKETQAFFASNNVGVNNAYQIFNFYRVGGPPTNIHDLAIVGPDSYQVGSQNLTLLWAQNINGVTFRDLWLSSGWYGIAAEINSGDSHMSRTTSEYCFGATVYTDATSEISVDFCNIWASAAVAGQRGIYALGRGSATNSRFVGHVGTSFQAASGIFNNNFIELAGNTAGGNVVSIAQDGIVVGNEFVGGSASAMLRIGRDSVVSSNTFNQSNEHPCINAGDGSASSAVNIAITGNTLIKTNANPEAQNYAIVSEEAGVSYTGAATSSLLISGNTFSGRALEQIGTATLANNSFSGAVSSAGAFTQKGDVLGNQVMTGTDPNASYTLTITGMLGTGKGNPRDLQRLNLVSVVSAGSGHVVRGWALYTSQYNGNAVLVATLGSSVIGGTITFGTSGANPTVTITNTSGLPANYSVRAIPLV